MRRRRIDQNIGRQLRDTDHVICDTVRASGCHRTTLGGSMKRKLKAHLWTLPRWFAAPFFGSTLLLGAVLAGDISANSWWALVAGLLIMAGGHSFNSYLDYAWTGIDKGEVEERSAEKAYTGGQNLLANGIVSQREVLA